MFPTRETDPMLRRFERNQAVATLVMAAIAVVWRLDVALGVLGGGLLMAISYRAIRGGVDAFVPAGGNGAAPARSASKRRALLVAQFVGRYALLALVAYVMLVRLHAHPVGLLIGAASSAVAVAAEAVRVVRAWSRPPDSR
jgi:hypothetical protein